MILTTKNYRQRMSKKKSESGAFSWVGRVTPNKHFFNFGPMGESVCISITSIIDYASIWILIEQYQFKVLTENMICMKCKIFYSNRSNDFKRNIIYKENLNNNWFFGSKSNDTYYVSCNKTGFWNAPVSLYKLVIVLLSFIYYYLIVFVMG